MNKVAWTALKKAVNSAHDLASETGPQHAGFKLRNRMGEVTKLLDYAVQLIDDLDKEDG